MAREHFAFCLLALISLVGLGTANAIAQSFQWPVDNGVCAENCYATFNDVGNQKYHTGLDITSSSGSRIVRAAAAGTVRAIPLGTYNNSNHCMGNVVIIDHDNGKGPFSLYAHLASITISNGFVPKGTQIGVMGNTGTANSSNSCSSIGIHLHFELKFWGVMGNISDDSGPYYGYTPGHPNLYGYINPRPYLELNISNLAPVAITSSGGQIIRTGPDSNSYTTTVATVLAGQKFAAFATSNGWYQVFLPSINGPASGWIQGTQDSTSALLEISYTRVPTDVVGANIRDAASTAGNRLSYAWDKQWLVHLGTSASGNGCNSSWYQTSLANNAAGSSGWLCGQFAIFHPGGGNQPPSCTVSYSPSTVIYGQSLTITWDAQNATSRSYVITNSAGAVLYGPFTPSIGGSRIVNPFTDLSPGTYIRKDTVTGAGGTGNCQATLTVTSPSLPTCTISYSPSTVVFGQSLTVTWDAQNATSRSYVITNSAGAVLYGPFVPALTGSRIVNPFTDLSRGTYIRKDTVTGSGGTGNCQATLTVT